MQLRVHSFVPLSRANGPGARAVLWVQGCSLGCPACFNPHTHSFNQGDQVKVGELVDAVVSCGDSIEGITVSGGEPLQQPAAITELLRRLKQETVLSTLLFTGFSWEEIHHGGTPRSPSDSLLDPTPSPAVFPMQSPAHPSSHPQFLNYLDVLVAGRYFQHQRLAHGLRGSRNKTVHFLTSRYTFRDLEAVPPAEIILSPEGDLVVSGIEPLKW